MTTLAELHRVARERLTEAGISDAALDARVLVEEITGTSRTDLLARPDLAIPAESQARLDEALARRARHEPVHRILGWREFHGLTLRLSTETLEPRPDTETLVETVLPFVRETAAREGVCRILDLGTGTGAIALALINEEPRATAVATDISEDALRTAEVNAVAAGLAGRFSPVLSDWFSRIQGRFHLIASNPPYIESEAVDRLEPEVRLFDPLAALDGGSDGLDAYRKIAAHAAQYLEAGGRVAVEIGHRQKAAVETLFCDAGFRLLEARSDLGGNDRVMVFTHQEAAEITLGKAEEHR